MKLATADGGAAVSPYTPQTVDIAITHLERVLCAEGADLLFLRLTGAVGFFRHMRRGGCCERNRNGYSDCLTGSRALPRISSLERRPLEKCSIDRAGI